MEVKYVFLHDFLRLFFDELLEKTAFFVVKTWYFENHAGTIFRAKKRSKINAKIDGKNMIFHETTFQKAFKNQCENGKNREIWSCKKHRFPS